MNKPGKTTATAGEGAAQASNPYGKTIRVATWLREKNTRADMDIEEARRFARDILVLCSEVEGTSP